MPTWDTGRRVKPPKMLARARALATRRDDDDHALLPLPVLALLIGVHVKASSRPTPAPQAPLHGGRVGRGAEEPRGARATGMVIYLVPWAAVMPKFVTARFNALTGPPELFERVRFKMLDVRVLKTHARHVQDRGYERDAPLDILQNFDPDRWRLMTAEVRTDKGKFVNSTWSVNVVGQEWWVVIGFDATIKTVIRASRWKLALGTDIVRSGKFYDYVASVNRQLMLDDG